MLEKYSITKKEEVFNLLKGKRNFEFMSERLLRKLIDVMKVIRFRDERVLLNQDAENSFCYIIIKGSVSVFVDGRFLYKLQRTGDIFGEISFITQSASTATIKAEKDLGVIAISYSFFNKLNDIELSMWLSRVLAEKLVRTSKLKTTGDPLDDLEQLSEQASKEISDEEITDLEQEASENAREDQDAEPETTEAGG